MKIGTYPVNVTVTDESGRTVTSNELTFKVYSTKEKLADHLKLENATKTADGKYMYDMDPWVIPDFNDTDDIVTVPAEIKAWYGSHTSGTQQCEDKSRKWRNIESERFFHIWTD